MRRYTLLVIVALCFATTIDAYEPLTQDEAREYVDRYPDAAAADVIALDAIEHATPTTNAPQMVIAQENDGTITAWFRDPLIVDVAGRLRYSIDLPTASIDSYPKRDPVTWFLVGTGTGFALAIILAIAF